MGPYHATSRHWLLLASGADTQTHTLSRRYQFLETRRVPGLIKRSDFEASLCKLALTDASGNFIKDVIVNKVINILW